MSVSFATMDGMAVDHAAPLVGRDEELAQLKAAIGLSGDAGSGAVLLGGDAGIGKTRLVTELVDQARDAGRQILVGHCLDLGDSALPFAPFAEAFSSLDDADRERITAEAPALGPMISAAPAGGDRADILSAVARGLDALAETGPILLVVEDAHWAEASTRHALQFVLARRFVNDVAVVVTYRTDDLHRRHPLRTAVAEWSRLPGVRRVELAPLDDVSVAALLRSREESRLTQAGVSAIVRRAGGNAFYAEELLDAGLADGALPESLADLVLVRLDRLDDDARQVVAAVASGGGRASDDILAEVVGLEPARFDAAVRDALDHKVLVLRDGGLAFRHALLAEAVREDLLPGQRIRQHAAFLAALTRPGAEGAAREIAHHAEGAGDLATAFTASIDAAVEAVCIGGYDEAAGHYQRALTMLEAAPEGTDVVALLLSTAEALTGAGRLRTAAKLLRAQLDQSGLSELDRGRLLVALGDVTFFSDDDDGALEVSAEALAVVPDERTELRARAEALRARTFSSVRRWDEALEHAERALAIAEELDAVEIALDAQGTSTYVLSRTGLEVDKAHRLYLDLIESTRASGDVHSELRALQHLAFVHFNAGNLPEAEQYFREGMARAEATGRSWAPYGFDGRFFAAVTSYVRGRWDDVLALQKVDDGVPKLVRNTLDSVALLVAAGRGQEPAKGEVARLRGEWAHDLALAVHSGTAMIELQGNAGDAVAATEVHDALADLLARTWHSTLSPARLRMTSLLLSAHAATAGQRSAAENQATVEWATALVAEVDHVLIEWPTLGPEGHAWHQRMHAELGRLRWLTGVDPLPVAELERLWRTALESFDQLGDPYEHARSATRLAAVLSAAGRDAEAEELLAGARQVAQEIGAKPLLAEISSGAAPERSADLTRREREVLELVSVGRTNGEIAAQLFISTKTASVHVSNILAKLGASSRTEAAAIANRRGLL
ncbi:tetratricopeptide repeat protein [Aeromicrobium terrae]|uniref:Tetratricopeptide repeat protein n=2 Tax=Aeromicrobium terrae TaxID=2498846 RepID=A0A5C8NH87_9ACTN|nr:tetratricopeptide repeat protein [Aeromicrobium terrae]